jgi:hypothetical protein
MYQKGVKNLSVPGLVYREYMTSPKSMAGQMFDVKNVITSKRYIKKL